MKPTSTRTKIVALLFALLMSAAVLGSTVAGMMSGSAPPSQVVTLERTIVMAPTSTRVN